MGEESVLSEESESVTNGKAEEKAKYVTEKTEDMAEKSNEQCGGVNEMEEDKGGDGNVEALDLDVDKEEVNKSKKIEEKGAKESEQEGIEGAKGQEKQDTVPEEAKEDNKSQERAGDSEDITKRQNEDKVDKEDDGMKAVEEKPEEPKEEKSWKKRPRSKSSAGKQDKSKKKNSEEHTVKESKTPTDKKIKESKTMVERKEETKTPATPTIERPVRERKSVERLVAAIGKDSAKEFHVEKGRGTALKDIPKGAEDMLNELLVEEIGVTCPPVFASRPLLPAPKRVSLLICPRSIRPPQTISWTPLLTSESGSSGQWDRRLRWLIPPA